MPVSHRYLLSAPFSPISYIWTKISDPPPPHPYPLLPLGNFLNIDSLHQCVRKKASTKH